MLALRLSYPVILLTYHKSLRFLVCPTLYHFFQLYFLFCCLVHLSNLSLDVRGPRSINTTLNRGGICQGRLPHIHSMNPLSFFFFCFPSGKLSIYLFIFIYLNNTFGNSFCSETRRVALYPPTSASPQFFVYYDRPDWTGLWP